LLDDLLERGVIELPKSKRLEEAGRVIDPKYYRYQKVISHLLKDALCLRRA